MNRETYLLDLGVRDYAETWNLQKYLVHLRQRGRVPDVLILVEHPHTITVGRHHDPENVLTSELPIFEVERGGDATYHGAGQIVGYPIVSLSELKRDIGSYLRALEGVIIGAAAELGVRAERIRGQTGVWVGDKKLASIGIAVQRWVAFHGFALNGNTDLSYFNHIRPCGFPSSIMTSLQQILGHNVDEGFVRELVCTQFEKVFDTVLSGRSHSLLEAGFHAGATPREDLPTSGALQASLPTSDVS